MEINNMDYMQIVTYGQFYYPAWKHYNNPNINVCCDRCGKKHLDCSIGLIDKDLCLRCTDEVVFNYKKNLNILPRSPFIEPFIMYGQNSPNSPNRKINPFEGFNPKIENIPTITTSLNGIGGNTNLNFPPLNFNTK